MKIFKGICVFTTGLVATLYLANIGAGVIELIPDNIPIIGNLDEAAATLLLINCLAYFGLDLRRFFPPRAKRGEMRNVNKPLK